LTSILNKQELKKFLWPDALPVANQQESLAGQTLEHGRGVTPFTSALRRQYLKKIWWDCVKNDLESLGLSQNDAQSGNKWRRRIKGATG